MCVNQACVGYNVRNAVVVRSDASYGFILCGSSPVYIENVVEDGPAHAAGLVPGDVIVAVDGTDVRSVLISISYHCMLLMYRVHRTYVHVYCYHSRYIYFAAPCKQQTKSVNNLVM